MRFDFMAVFFIDSCETIRQKLLVMLLIWSNVGVCHKVNCMDSQYKQKCSVVLKRVS